MLIWCAAYMVYLGVFWLPQTSTFRILLPLFPLALVLMNYGKDSRAYRWLLVFFGLVLQLIWVGWLWHSHGPGGLEYTLMIVPFERSGGWSPGCSCPKP